ncbi:beta-1,4-galactosyltransferase 6-like isoform X2 [Petromyzon marinus]|uniref:beta-1,4-galactosyltransferase 6-like isoform X2 n=1 Tax=Petromyzon marinus TaxID=7757 RepID=UPI003F7149F4
MKKSSRRLLALLFLFSFSSSFMYFIYVAPGIANTYLFVIQARTSEVHRSLGNFYAQVIRVGMRAANSSLNDTEGEMEVNMSEVSMGEVSRQLARDMHIEPGGFWRPSDCQPRWKVAILIPFRNRHEHLPILLRHLLPILYRQRLEFGIFVVEQAGSRLFNRAMLFNAGFMAALRSYSWDCFVFHDVDHVPENDRNYYGCSEMPRHFAVKLDKYAYKLPYTEFFGGVSGLTTEQFKTINGFPNAFWGWGGEDDDLWNRVTFAGYNVSRPEGEIGRYKSIPHHHRGEVQFLGRYSLLRRSRERSQLDGLINLRFEPTVSVEQLYTNISIHLTPDLAPVSDY